MTQTPTNPELETDIRAITDEWGLDDNAVANIASLIKKEALKARLSELSLLTEWTDGWGVNLRARHERSYKDRIADLKKQLGSK